MAKALDSVADVEEYAAGLTLDADGLPPLTEEPDNIAKLVQHQTRVGKDVFSINRFIQWTNRLRERAVQNATARNPFGKAGPCPISEKEFEEYAPDDVHGLFLNDQEWERLQKAFPTGIGQKLRCMKKAGEGKLNPGTGKKSGGRYGSGSYGYFLSGVISIPVKVPGKGEVTVKGRPTINMALEGTRTKDAAGDGPMTGQVGDDDDDGEEQVLTSADVGQLKV